VCKSRAGPLRSDVPARKGGNGDRMASRLTPAGAIVGYFHAPRNNVQRDSLSPGGNISARGHRYADGVRGVVIDCGYAPPPLSLSLSLSLSLCLPAACTRSSSYSIRIKEPRVFVGLYSHRTFTRSSRLPAEFHPLSVTAKLPWIPLKHAGKIA